MEQVRLKAIINGKTAVFTVECGMTALDALEANGVTVYAPCGGAGHCGGCRAKIKGKIRPISDEAAVLGEAFAEKDVHLLCSTELLGDAEVEITTDIAGIEREIFDSADKGTDYGVAIDIGTTTVAVYICRLDDGRVVFEDAFLNPQSRFGADVITRVAAIKNDAAALEKQRKVLLEQINASIGKFSSDRARFSRAVICGNTVMEHIAAGFDPCGIAEYPFKCESLFGYSIEAEKVGLDIKHGAGVYFAPCIASYVGGDISCGLTSVKFDEASGDALYIDVGTNGEIALVHDGEIYFCSAAAGPALEGAGISHGMPSIEGAIKEVQIKDDILLYKTVKDKAAQGICGSGVIDAVSALKDVRAIDETGRMVDNPLICTVNGKRALKICDGVFFNEDDVRAVQLAKAAIAAGIKVLVERSGAKLSSLEKVIISGGFGSNINIENAVKIGLFPKEILGRAVSVGNAAGMGAVEILTDDKARERAERLARNGKYIELSFDKRFGELFVDEMGFDI